MMRFIDCSATTKIVIENYPNLSYHSNLSSSRSLTFSLADEHFSLRSFFSESSKPRAIARAKSSETTINAAAESKPNIYICLLASLHLHSRIVSRARNISGFIFSFSQVIPLVVLVIVCCAILLERPNMSRCILFLAAIAVVLHLVKSDG